MASALSPPTGDSPCTDSERLPSGSNDDKFQGPSCVKGRFQCPWTTYKRPNVLRFLWKKYNDTTKDQILSKEVLDSTSMMEVLTPDTERLLNPPTDQMQVTWLGHATALVQFDGLNLLVDPILHDGAIGPIRALGLKRVRRSPAPVSSLPRIDMVLISHDHYDHLDVATVRAIDQAWPSEVTWFVPQRMREWMAATIKSKNIVELSWWNEHVLTHSSDSAPTRQFTVACVPAQHWSMRSGFDENVRLWCGWVVHAIDTGRSVYYTGDTGYCEVFRAIGERYGPIDVGLIPIGCYKPRDIMVFQHIDPTEAVKIHQDVRVKNSVGIHWGTFDMGSTEAFLEPPKLLASACEEMGVDNFITIKHGETVAF